MRHFLEKQKNRPSVSGSPQTLLASGGWGLCTQELASYPHLVQVSLLAC